MSLFALMTPRNTAASATNKLPTVGPNKESSNPPCHKKQKLSKTSDLPHASSVLWWQRLEHLKHPTTVRLAKTLDRETNWGFSPCNLPKGFASRISDTIVRHKETCPTHIVFVRSGNFYTAYGIDAVLCMEYANLNPTGMGCRVGAPVKTIQTYLNALLVAGFEILLVENNDTLHNITCFNPTYYPSNVTTMCVDSVNPPPPHIAVYVQHDYLNLYVVNSTSMTVDMYENIPLQSFETIVNLHWSSDTTCHIDAMGTTERLSCSSLKFKQLQWQCTPEIFLDAYIHRLLSLDSTVDFVCTTHSEVLKRCTIEQLGLCSTPTAKNVRGVPNLASTVCPNVPQKCLAFLTKLLVTPPKYTTRCLLQTAVQQYSELSTPLPATPSFTIASGSCITLLRTKKATSTLLRKIMVLMQWVLQLDTLPLGASLHSIASALGVCRIENYEDILEKLRTQSHDIQLCLGQSPETISSALAENPLELTMQEAVETWHGHVAVLAVQEKQQRVSHIRKQYLRASREGVNGDHQLVWCGKMRMLASLCPQPPHKSILKDDKGKELKHKNRPLYELTQCVNQAGQRYTSLCSQVQSSVDTIISDLNGRISEALVSYVDFVWTLHRTISAHVQFGLRNHWCRATFVESSTATLELTKLKPYWIANGIENDIKLDGLVLLTGGNMGGKSTLCRATAAAALLGKTGLMVPAQSARLQHNVHIFLRAGNADCAQNGLSGFAAECVDIASLIQTARSGPTLALCDEIVSGTSSMEGSAIAVAIICALRNLGTVGFFSTHFEEMFAREEIQPLPKMQLEQKSDLFTYKLIPGVCQYRFATNIARSTGIPEYICKHADDIIQQVSGKRVTPPESKLSATSVVFQRLQRHYDMVVGKGQECPATTHSCVYLLDCPGGWYVGETDDLCTRYRAHFLQSNKNPSYMYVWKMNNKSEARHVETMVVEDLMRVGLTLLSTKDGCHLHFGGN